jgi:hypothetical protein
MEFFFSPSSILRNTNPFLHLLETEIGEWGIVSGMARSTWGMHHISTGRALVMLPTRPHSAAACSGLVHLTMAHAAAADETQLTSDKLWRLGCVRVVIR